MPELSTDMIRQLIISLAAFLVEVMARIEEGLTLWFYLILHCEYQ